MGDFRAEIKIKMHLAGKNYENEWAWINYYPDNNGVDSRVSEWFNQCWEDAQMRYKKCADKYQQIEMEQKERNELKRLKKKYGEEDK